MLKIEDAVIINQYAQGLIEYNSLLEVFNSFDLEGKIYYLKEIAALIMQSKPKKEDIEPAVITSNLKSTYTPCVLLRKGVESYRLQRIIELPENELEKVFVLFLSLFKIAYYRRFEQERNNPDKWWYWDLSDSKKVSAIISNYSSKEIL